ncbi:hypothetical protein [Nocardia aurea]|uniref:Uncharacterized protein n=1 Tax=Nocardia aurea TaxID=2144174 RepID=A0ABV3G1R4_9NOCA
MSTPLTRTDYWNRTGPVPKVRNGDTTHAEAVSDIETFTIPAAHTTIAALHLFGIADGYIVTATTGAPDLRVGTGVAFDQAGRLTLLIAGGVAVIDQTVDADIITDVPTAAVDAAGIVLPTGDFTGTKVLTVRAREVGVEGLLGNAPTLVHAPWLRLLDPAEVLTGTDLVLAQVIMSAGGVVSGITAEGRALVGGHGQRFELRRPVSGTLRSGQQPAASLSARADGGIELNLLTPGQPPRLAWAIDPSTASMSLGAPPTTTAEAALQIDRGATDSLALKLTSAGPGWGSGLRLANTSASARTYGMYSGSDAKLHITDVGAGLDRLVIDAAGAVGIGIGAGPARRALHVEGTEIHSGGTAGGFSFADRAVGTFTEAPAAGQRYVWYASGGIARLWSGADLFSSSPGEGNVLDTSRRMRVRQGPDHSAGIWFFQRGPGQDRAFVGMASDTEVGFWGSTGAGWGLKMQTGTGDVTLSGFFDTARRMRVRQGPDHSAGIWFFQRGPGQDRGFVGMASDTEIGFWGNTGAGWGLKMDTATGTTTFKGGSGPFQSAIVAKGNIGVWAEGAASGILASGNPAGTFLGDVRITGSLSKGGGGFTIDHPLDPEAKLLSHSFVESPEMMNLYRGTVVTDADGSARVTLPDWFDALNDDIGYQLTVVGEPTLTAIAEPVRDNAFTLCSERPHTTVCWQVSGVRQDKWANANRIRVEQEKSPAERDRYLHHAEYHQPATTGIAHTVEE